MQPAPGCLGGPTLLEPWAVISGPGPGRQYWPADRCGQVRLAARLPIQHLCVLVDSPGDDAVVGGPESHYSAASPRGGAVDPGASRRTRAAGGDGPDAVDRDGRPPARVGGRAYRRSTARGAHAAVDPS